MELIDMLPAISRVALEALIPSVALGILIVIAVSLSLRTIRHLNAATRGTVWALTLAVLAIILAAYLARHIVPAEPAANMAIPAALAPVPTPTVVAHQSVRQASAEIPLANSRTPDRRLDIALPREMPVIAVGTYFAIVVLLLSRLLIGYLRVCLLRRRTRPAPAALNSRLPYWLARCPTSRNVELRLSGKVRSPIAIGFIHPMIVMPAALMLELSEEELDDLGVHELAHIRRYDDWSNLLQHILQAFLFFHPAAHWAGRKLNFEREVACDDWVVSANRTKAYAKCLAKVVELRGWQRGAVLSSGAFFGKRQILKRVQVLLDKTRNSATSVSALTVAAVVILLVGITMEVAQLPAVIAITQDAGHMRSSNRWQDDTHDLRVNIRGEIVFSPDERSIVSLLPWGSVEIEDRKGWSRRRLEVRPSSSGVPAENYFVDGSRKPIDANGRAWAASTYQFLIRELGIDVEGRVGRILERSGADGVLQEVNLIQADNIKRQYLTQLLEQATLTEEDLRRVAMCTKKMSSDNDKAEFLVANVQLFAADPLRKSYFKAVDSIASDNDRRRVLIAMLEADGQSPETARLTGLSAQSMNSDNDKAEVLVAIPPAAGKMQCAMLEAARTIQSDNDKARVLRNSGYVESAQCRDAYFAVVNLLQSDHDRATVLHEMLGRSGLEPATYQNVAAAAKAMSSDNDKADVLTLLSGYYSEPPFFDAAGTLHSDNDRKRVLMSVIGRSPAKTALLNVVESALAISSDNDKAEVLMAAAKASTDPEVRLAIQRGCAKLNSDSDYRRVASVLFSGTTESN